MTGGPQSANTYSMSESVDIMNTPEDFQKNDFNKDSNCQLLSTCMKTHKIKGIKHAAVYCTRTCQTSEQYTEYFTHKVKYFFMYPYMFEYN